TRTTFDTAPTARIRARCQKGGVPVYPAKGGDSENAGRARQGRRVVRKRHEALQEAVREGRHPERDQEARALREAVGQAQEEGAGGEEARPQEGAEGNDVIPFALNPHTTFSGTQDEGGP